MRWQNSREMRGEIADVYAESKFERVSQHEDNTPKKSPVRRGGPDEAFLSGAPLRLPDQSFRASTYSTT